MAQILVLEDDPDQNTLICDVLTIDNHTCLPALTVDAAEVILARQQVDLAILDMNLPERSGIDLLRIMRGDPALANIPAIIVTANPQYQRQAESIGAELFLLKPLNLDQLLLLVNRYLPG